MAFTFLPTSNFSLAGFWFVRYACKPAWAAWLSQWFNWQTHTAFKQNRLVWNQIKATEWPPSSHWLLLAVKLQFPQLRTHQNVRSQTDCRPNTWILHDFAKKSCASHFAALFSGLRHEISWFWCQISSFPNFSQLKRWFWMWMIWRLIKISHRLTDSTEPKDAAMQLNISMRHLRSPGDLRLQKLGCAQLTWHAHDMDPWFSVIWIDGIWFCRYTYPRGNCQWVGLWFQALIPTVVAKPPKRKVG